MPNEGHQTPQMDAMPLVDAMSWTMSRTLSKWWYAARRHKYTASKCHIQQVSRWLTCNLITKQNSQTRLQAAWETSENWRVSLLDEISRRSLARSSAVEMRARAARSVTNPLTTMSYYEPNDKKDDDESTFENAINAALNRAEKYEEREQFTRKRGRVRSHCYKDGSLTIIDYDELDAWLSSDTTVSARRWR